MKESGPMIQTQEATNVRLSEARVWGFAAGNFAYDFMYFWVNTYMMIYFTDILGVQVAFIPALMMIVRVFDAINDPIIGWLQDSSTKLKMGRYRPYILYGGILYAVSVILMFNGNADWSANGKVVFMYIIYILVTVFATVQTMALGGFMCVITTDENSRVRLASRRMVCANGANGTAGVTAVIALAYFSGSGGSFTQEGFTPSIIIYCGIALLLNFVCVGTNKERVRPQIGEKISFIQSIKTLYKNTPAVFVYIGYGLFGFIVYGVLPMFAYYYTYVANDAVLMGRHSLMWGLGAICGSYFIAPFIMKRVSSIKAVLVSGLTFFGVIYLALYFVAGRLGGPVGDYGNLFWVMIFIASLGIGTFLTGVFTAYPNIVDLGEYNTGIRSDAFLSALGSTALKLGGAVAPTIGSSMLASSGYVANAAQNPETIQAMIINVSIIPGIAGVVGGLVMLGYPLSGKRVKEIQAELARRRGEEVVENVLGEQGK